MKYIKKFNKEEKSIEEWCESLQMNYDNISVNDTDNTIDVYSNVDVSRRDFEIIPIKFGIVDGWFDCSFNNLDTLEGSPKKVYAEFSCSGNRLVTLEGGPKEVSLDYFCENNQLISLDGFPDDFNAEMYCSKNPIYEIYKLFGPNVIALKRYKDSLDYNYLRGRNVIKHRFVEALEEIGKEAPLYITGYKYI